MVKMIKNRRGRMIVAAFQGVVGETIVLEGTLGIPIPVEAVESLLKRAEFGIASGCTIHHEPPSQLNIEQPLDFLVVAPHPDDAEPGLGGTIAKMVDEGYVGILDLTSGEPTPHGSEAL